jgi:septal ring factor EnvC (AmiA/AmiB activator)
MHALAQDMNFRNRCNADIRFYFDHFDRCFVAVGETVFTTRDQQIRSAYDDINRMRTQRTMQLRQLEAQERDLDDRIAGTRREVAALQSRRAALSQQDEAVRLAITSLSDVTVFWDGARSLLSHRVGDQLGLLNDLLPTLDRTKKRPVFDRADRAEIKSLRDTLLDFAKSVDGRNNFLLAPAICQ